MTFTIVLFYTFPTFFNKNHQRLYLSTYHYPKQIISIVPIVLVKQLGLGKTRTLQEDIWTNRRFLQPDVTVYFQSTIEHQERDSY